MSRVAVFASGGGTNLQALIEHLRADATDAGRVALVVSDREGAGALERARAAGIDTRVIAVRDRSVDDVARETLEVLDDAGIDLVALAGYLRLLPGPVVRRYERRIVNIHPALLPAFGGKGMYGMRVHHAVLAAGSRVTGATVHFVDEAYDTGPILAQWPVPVLADDSPETLAARVLRVEHRLYPAAVEALLRARGRGEDVRPAPTTARAFTLADADGPPVGAIRRYLGLE